MAQIPFRGNLQAATFPLLSQLSGRTVISSEADQTFVQRVNADAAAPVELGVPSVVYAHNVMPSVYGWQSVGYRDLYAAPAAVDAALFQDIHLVQAAEVVESTDEEGTTTTSTAATNTTHYIALARDFVDDKSWIYVLNPDTGQFERNMAGLPTLPGNVNLTSTTVNGVTYLYLSTIGAFIYESATDSFIEREFTALDKSDIQGITSSNGYMFAWTYKSIAWSSAVDIEDFEPSDISGAGGGSIQEAEGPVVACVPTVHGIIIMTEQNAVSCIYSGNDDFPWNLKAIPGSGGIADKYQIGIKPAGQFYYSFTNNGIQQISHLKCNTALPHISDFISGGLYEDFDIFTDTFIQQVLTYPMNKAITTCSDRYVIVSYGVQNSQVFSHAIIVDLLLGRIGKVRVEHVLCFERKDIIFQTDEAPRDVITFMLPSGKCRVLEFAAGAETNDSVLILGKFQLARSRLIELQELELENVGDSTETQVKYYVSPDGKTLGTPRQGYLYRTAPNLQHWFIGGVGVNASILITGSFNIVSYVLWSNPHGRM